MKFIHRPLTQAETTAVRRFEEKTEQHVQPADAAYYALSVMLRGDLSADFIAWLSDGAYRLSHAGKIERVYVGRPKPILDASR